MSTYWRLSQNRVHWKDLLLFKYSQPIDFIKISVLFFLVFYRVRSKLKVQNSSTFQGPKLHFSSTKIIDKKPYPRRGHSKLRLHTSACFKIVNMCKISTFARFKFKDFSSTFKHLICFQALSRALKFLFQIQAFSSISQARYEPWFYEITNWLELILHTGSRGQLCISRYVKNRWANDLTTVLEKWSPVLLSLYRSWRHRWPLRAATLSCSEKTDRWGSLRMSGDQCRQSQCSPADCWAPSVSHITI